MLQAFVITLREGLEAFLIVAISLAYLRKTGRPGLVSAVHWGIGVSIVVSIAAALLFQQASNQALWEGVLALVAAVLVASLIVHMWRHARKIKHEIETRLESSALQTGAKAFAGVFLFTLLMITREGMETALLLMQVKDPNLISGALLGLLAAVAFAFGWARFGHLINVRRFFQVTGIFLLLFMVQVSIYSFHEFSEAGLLPNSDYLHEATEKFSPDGLYGKWFSAIMIGICALWLLIAWLKDRRHSSHPQITHMTQTESV